MVILPAELPDKTIFATLILASRYRPRYVYAGAAVGFLVQVVLAVAAGGAISLLPHRGVQAATAAAFLVGAVLLWRHKAGDDDDVRRDSSRNAFWPVATTSFVVVALAEFGDLTQIMTATLAAKYHDPFGVGAGALLALWIAAGLAVVVGWRLLKVIPVTWLTRGAAVIMVALAGTSAFEAFALRGVGGVPPREAWVRGPPRPQGDQGRSGADLVCADRYWGVGARPVRTQARRGSGGRPPGQHQRGSRSCAAGSSPGNRRSDQAKRASGGSGGRPPGQHQRGSRS